MTWTGTHWAIDHAVAARNELLSVLREELRSGMAERDKTARQCMSNNAQQGVLAIAADLPTFRVQLDQLDADPYLVNTPAGTYDLREHVLRDHDPRDFITKITTASYNPEADASTWLEHLSYFQPDAEIQQFLQRFFGYTLLGKVTEHVLLIAYGPKGANGKGTTDRAIQHALGDYATTAPNNLLVATRENSADSPSPARFALKGRRYISMSETEKRVHIAEALMKNLTGGDKIYARAMRKDPVVFAPSHTFVLYTNFKPMLSANDSGVWRRVLLLPFDVSRPESEQDANIDTALELEADAILTWMLDGYRQYVDQGLNPPASIKAATSEYQYEEDSISQFIDTMLMPDSQAVTPTREIWSEWEVFAHENRLSPITQKELYHNLEQRGYTKVRHAIGNVFKGVAIRDTSAPDDINPDDIQE